MERQVEMHPVNRWLMLCSVSLVLTTPSRAGERAPWSLELVLERVPPLKHDATGRLPMITWPAFRSGDRDGIRTPFSEDEYRELYRRGLTQRLPFDTNSLPAALVMQRAGVPIVFLQGETGHGPFGEGPDPLHRLPEGFEIVKGAGSAGRDHFPCLGLLEGWRRRADRLRKVLQVYKDAGVHVDAVWLDWEGEPHVTRPRYEQARACSRCQAILPKGVLDSMDNYFAYATQLRADLLSAYVARPVLELYPGCSVTSWEMVFSSAERRTWTDWGQGRFLGVHIGLLTAANPVVYGNTIYHGWHWKQEWGYPLDVPHMDRLYTHIMLAQISQHAANAAAMGPFKQSVPWVCRYCPEAGDPDVPILSRTRYREILRHVWLRGADAMQIFNEPYPNHPYPEIPIEEVEDVVAVYDEMLAYREFLDHGTIMNTDVPAVTEDGAIWSGLRLETEVLIRAFTQGSNPAPFTIEVWDRAVSLEAPPRGATYRVSFDGKIDEVTRATGRN